MGTPFPINPGQRALSHTAWRVCEVAAPFVAAFLSGCSICPAQENPLHVAGPATPPWPLLSDPRAVPLLQTDFETPQVPTGQDWVRIEDGSGPPIPGWTGSVDLHANLVAHGHQLVDLNTDFPSAMSTKVRLPENARCTLRFFHGVNGWCTDSGAFHVSITLDGSSQPLAAGDYGTSSCQPDLTEEELAFKTPCSAGGATLVFQSVAPTDRSCGPTVDDVGLVCLTDPPALGYWKFDDATNLGKDSSPNQLDATMSGTPLFFANAHVNGGVELATHNPFVVVPHQAKLDLTDAMTVSAWVQPGQCNGPDQAIVTLGDRNGGSFSLELSHQSWTFIVHMQNGATASVSVPCSIASTPDPRAGWIHLAGVKEATELRLYVNEDLVTSTQAPSPIAVSALPLSIGHRQHADEFRGAIDEVRLFGVPLTASEVNYLQQVECRIPDALNDLWSDRVVLRSSSLTNDIQSGYVAPIHVSLLPNGHVLIMGYVRATEEFATTVEGEKPIWRAPPFAGELIPTPLGQTPPPEVWLTNQQVPYKNPYRAPSSNGGIVFDTLFCSGHTLLSDGSLFAAGGTENGAPNSALGLDYSMRYDPNTKTWARLPDMVGIAPPDTEARRWYPAAIRLPSRDVLILNGFYRFPFGSLVLGPDMTTTAEIYSPGRNSYRQISQNQYGWTYEPLPNLPLTPPDTHAGFYPHAYVLPDETVYGDDVIVLGEAGAPEFLELDSDPVTWTGYGATREGRSLLHGADAYAAGAMLPIRLNNTNYSNGTLMTVGGACEPNQPLAVAPNESKIDFFDPVTTQWLNTLDMGVGRHHSSVTALPDGRMLIFGGWDDCVSDNPPTGLGKTQFVDPLDHFSLYWGANEVRERVDHFMRPEAHGYHVVSLLLPDGRVLLGGGRHGTTYQERTMFRYYSPSYMFRTRPQIVNAPDQIYYGKSFDIQWATREPKEVVLMALGSMTHGFDSNQRYVQLPIASSTANVIKVSAPPHVRRAPEGYYMLFILGDDNTPSEARIVRLFENSEVFDPPASLYGCGAASHCYVDQYGDATNGCNPDVKHSPTACITDSGNHTGTNHIGCFKCTGGYWWGCDGSQVSTCP